MQTNLEINQAEILTDLSKKVELLTDMVEQLLEQHPPTIDPTRQVPLSKAWETLGYSSYDAMLGKIRSGFYRVGVEVFDCRSPGSRRANWKADINACLKRHSTPPAKRTAQSSSL